MVPYIVRRLLQVIPVLLGVSMIVFLMLRAIPGDPALMLLQENATQEALQALRQQMGLDQPLVVQYFIYMKHVVTGDLGISLRNQAPIQTELYRYFMATVELGGTAMLIAVFAGVNAGILAAWRKNSLFDHLLMTFSLTGVSMPIFWLALMSQWFFTEQLHLLPSTGRLDPRIMFDSISGLYLIDSLVMGNWQAFWDACKHLIMPSIVLSTIPMAVIARITRSSMLEVLHADYIRTAKAKGLSGLYIVYRHGLKNAAAPIMTIIGLRFGLILSGAILTETIFSWPGIGRYIYEAIAFRDFPVVQAGILFLSVLFIFINLVVDILYVVFDPRIQYR